MAAIQVNVVNLRGGTPLGTRAGVGSPPETPRRTATLLRSGATLTVRLAHE